MFHQKKAAAAKMSRPPITITNMMVATMAIRIPVWMLSIEESVASIEESVASIEESVASIEESVPLMTPTSVTRVSTDLSKASSESVAFMTPTSVTRISTDLSKASSALPSRRTCQLESLKIPSTTA